MYVDYILFRRGTDMKKKISVMVESGFVGKDYKGSDSEVEKKYKCFLSKKCNDEKFERIKKMFEYVKDNQDFIQFIGTSEYEKLNDSYGLKEKRGEVVRIEFDNMDITEVFNKYKLGVKEVLRKGYTMDGDIYKKIVKW